MASTYSEFQVFQDIHSAEDHSIDVSIASSLAPTRYEEVEYEYVNAPHGKEVQFINFYGRAIPADVEVEFLSEPFGTEAVFAIYFKEIRPDQYARQYFVLNDGAGTVMFWFSYNGDLTPPSFVASRDVMISITPTMTHSDIMTEIVNQINADLLFIALDDQPILIIATSKYDTSYILSTVPGSTTRVMIEGTSSINSKYLTLPNNNYVWWDVDGGGVDPNLVGKTSHKVQIQGVDTPQIICEKTVATLNTLGDMTANFEGLKCHFLYTPVVYSPVSNSSKLTTRIVNQGRSDVLVGRVQISYDTEWDITRIKRLL